MKGSKTLNVNLASKIIFFIVVTSLLLLVGCNDQEKANGRESQNAFDSQDSNHSKKSTAFVFQNINLITMTEDKVLENYSVVIKDGLIAEIGELQTVAIPEEAQ